MVLLSGKNPGSSQTLQQVIDVNDDLSGNNPLSGQVIQYDGVNVIWKDASSNYPNLQQVLTKGSTASTPITITGTNNTILSNGMTVGQTTYSNSGVNIKGLIKIESNANTSISLSGDKGVTGDALVSGGPNGNLKWQAIKEIQSLQDVIDVSDALNGNIPGENQAIVYSGGNIIWSDVNKVYTASVSTSGPFYPTFVSNATGNNTINTDLALNYDAYTHTLTCPSIIGNVTGTATKVKVTDTNSSNLYFLPFVDGAGDKPFYINSTSLSYTPSTSTLNAAIFSGKANSAIVADNTPHATNSDKTEQIRINQGTTGTYYPTFANNNTYSPEYINTTFAYNAGNNVITLKGAPVVPEYALFYDVSSVTFTAPELNPCKITLTNKGINPSTNITPYPILPSNDTVLCMKEWYGRIWLGCASGILYYSNGDLIEFYNFGSAILTIAGPPNRDYIFVGGNFVGDYNYIARITYNSDNYHLSQVYWAGLFNNGFNSTVRTMSFPDSNRGYIGGDFTYTFNNEKLLRNFACLNLTKETPDIYQIDDVGGFDGPVYSISSNGNNTIVAGEFSYLDTNVGNFNYQAILTIEWDGLYTVSVVNYVSSTETAFSGYSVLTTCWSDNDNSFIIGGDFNVDLYKNLAKVGPYGGALSNAFANQSLVYPVTAVFAYGDKIYYNQQYNAYQNGTLIGPMGESDITSILRISQGELLFSTLADSNIALYSWDPSTAVTVTIGPIWIQGTSYQSVILNDTGSFITAMYDGTNYWSTGFFNISNVTTPVIQSGVLAIGATGVNGTYTFASPFTSIPVVTLTQLTSSTNVGLSVTDVTNKAFTWAATANGVNKILWTAILS